MVADEANPAMRRLLTGEPDAETCLAVLRAGGGVWQDVVGGLFRAGGRGRYAALKLVRFRQRLIAELARFGAGPVATGSVEPISDVDLNVSGDGAGRRLIAAERYVRDVVGSDNWSELLRMNFYTEADRLTIYERVTREMTPDQQATMHRRLARSAELRNVARMLEHAGADPARRAPVEELGRRLGVDLSAAERLAETLADPVAAEAMRNRRLRQIDRLMRQLARTRGADGAAVAARVALSERISALQIEANFFTAEAYISPGAGRQTVRGAVVRGMEAYTAALAHVEMLEHVIGQAGGDLIRVGRAYEAYKYVNRFCQAARQMGIADPRLRSFEHTSAYLYRIERAAHEATAPTVDPRSQAARSQSMQGRPGVDAPIPYTSDGPAAGPATPATDAFAAGEIQQFLGLARELLPAMQQAAAQAPLGGPGAAPDQPSPRPSTRPVGLGPDGTRRDVPAPPEPSAPVPPGTTTRREHGMTSGFPEQPSGRFRSGDDVPDGAYDPSLPVGDEGRSSLEEERPSTPAEQAEGARRARSTRPTNPGLSIGMPIVVDGHQAALETYGELRAGGPRPHSREVGLYRIRGTERYVVVQGWEGGVDLLLEWVGAVSGAGPDVELDPVRHSHPSADDGRALALSRTPSTEDFGALVQHLTTHRLNSFENTLDWSHEGTAGTSRYGVERAADGSLRYWFEAPGVTEGRQAISDFRAYESLRRRLTFAALRPT